MEFINMFNIQFMFEFMNAINGFDHNIHNVPGVNFKFPPPPPPLPTLYMLPVDHFSFITTLNAENIKIMYEVPMDLYTNVLIPQSVSQLEGVITLPPYEKNCILIPNIPAELIQSLPDLHLVVVENHYIIRFGSSGRMYNLITTVPPENIINLYKYNNVSIIPLDNFVVITKSELKEIFPELSDLAQKYKFYLDYYHVITNIPKEALK